MSHLEDVKALLGRGGRHTLREIAKAITPEGEQPPSEASVSARLRDLRKAEFGGLNIDKQYAGKGEGYYYSLVRPAGVQMIQQPGETLSPGSGAGG